MKNQKKASRMGLLLLSAGLLSLPCASCGIASSRDALVVSMDDAQSVGASEAGQEAGASGESAASQETSAPEMFCVHICGAVNQPGVYSIASGTRLYEVVALAGGLREDAAEASVNLSRLVQDEEQIRILTREEAETASAWGGAAASQDEMSVSTGRININRADKEQLMTLPGIGAVKAEAILAYRAEHGAFQTVEELCQVEGIKSAVFEKIKDQIEV